MKQYVIDELRPLDYKKIKAYLDDNFGSSALDGLYWIELDRDILTDIQASHAQCLPFYFAANIESDHISFELLVRTNNRVRCSCIDYATEKQRNWIINFADTLFDKLKIQH